MGLGDATAEQVRLAMSPSRKSCSSAAVTTRVAVERKEGPQCQIKPLATASETEGSSIHTKGLPKYVFFLQLHAEKNQRKTQGEDADR